MLVLRSFGVWRLSGSHILLQPSLRGVSWPSCHSHSRALRVGPDGWLRRTSMGRDLGGAASKDSANEKTTNIRISLAKSKHFNCNYYKRFRDSYLHIGMVGGGEGLIYRCRTAPFTSIGIILLWINNPVTPTDLIKVYPHIHLPAERFILPSSCETPGITLAAASRTLSSVRWFLLWRRGAGSPPPLARFRATYLECSAVLMRVDVLPGSAWSNHHHDSIGCQMLDVLVPLTLRSRRHLNGFSENTLSPWCNQYLSSTVMLKTLQEEWEVVESIGFGFTVPRWNPYFIARASIALTFGCMINVHLHLRDECWKTNAKLRPLDVVARCYGGHVKCHG